MRLNEPLLKNPAVQSGLEDLFEEVTQTQSVFLKEIWGSWSKLDRAQQKKALMALVEFAQSEFSVLEENYATGSVRTIDFGAWQAKGFPFSIDQQQEEWALVFRPEGCVEDWSNACCMEYISSQTNSMFFSHLMDFIQKEPEETQIQEWLDVFRPWLVDTGNFNRFLPWLSVLQEALTDVSLRECIKAIPFYNLPRDSQKIQVPKGSGAHRVLQMQTEIVLEKNIACRGWKEGLRYTVLCWSLKQEKAYVLSKEGWGRIVSDPVMRHQLEVELKSSQYPSLIRSLNDSIKPGSWIVESILCSSFHANRLHKASRSMAEGVEDAWKEIWSPDSSALQDWMSWKPAQQKIFLTQVLEGSQKWLECFIEKMSEILSLCKMFGDSYLSIMAKIYSDFLLEQHPTCLLSPINMCTKRFKSNYQPSAKEVQAKTIAEFLLCHLEEKDRFLLYQWTLNNTLVDTSASLKKPRL